MIKFLILLFIWSCAHEVAPLRTTSKEDVFNNESYARWGRQDLRSVSQNALPLKATQARCHMGSSGNSSDHQNALKDFAQFLDEYQESTYYWNQIALCHIHHGQLPKAEYVLGLARQKQGSKQDLAPVYNNLGYIALKNRHFHQAKEYFEKSLQLHSQSLTARFNLSIILLHFGHHDIAYRHLRQIRQHNSSDQEVLSQLGFVQLAAGNFSAAHNYFTQLDESYRRRSDISAKMALTLNELNQPEEARRILLRQARTNDPMVRRMTQFTQREINKSLEMMREQQEQQRRVASEKGSHHEAE